MATLYEACDVCGYEIRRDIYLSASRVPSAGWLGVCGMPQSEVAMPLSER